MCRFWHRPKLPENHADIKLSGQAFLSINGKSVLAYAQRNHKAIFGPR